MIHWLHHAALTGLNGVVRSLGSATVGVLMPVEVGVVLIGAGFAVGVSLAVAVLFERWKAKQPDPEGE